MSACQACHRSVNAPQYRNGGRICRRRSWKGGSTPSKRNLSFTDDFDALVTNHHSPFSVSGAPPVKTCHILLDGSCCLHVSKACSRFWQLLKTIPDAGNFDLRPICVTSDYLRKGIHSQHFRGFTEHSPVCKKTVRNGCGARRSQLDVSICRP